MQKGTVIVESISPGESYQSLMIVSIQILMFQVHVNLIDLIDSRRRHRQVKVFQSLTRLQTYTKNTEKYFPLGGAKKRPLLKILLRGMN